uniref:Inverted formin-2-like n=1 Tax=Ascaris lumbricoides TaxID=6252 RepID=A0A0M3HUP9_ASCLU
MGDEYEAIGPPPGGEVAQPPQLFIPPPPAAPPYFEPSPPPPPEPSSSAGKQDEGTATDESGKKKNLDAIGGKSKQARKSKLKQSNSEEDNTGLSVLSNCSMVTIIILVLIGLIASGFVILLAVTKCFGDENCAIVSLIEKIILRRS